MHTSSKPSHLQRLKPRVTLNDKHIKTIIYPIVADTYTSISVNEGKESKHVYHQRNKKKRLTRHVRAKPLIARSGDEDLVLQEVDKLESKIKKLRVVQETNAKN